MFTHDTAKPLLCWEFFQVHVAAAVFGPLILPLECEKVPFSVVFGQLQSEFFAFPQFAEKLDKINPQKTTWNFTFCQKKSLRNQGQGRVLRNTW